MTPAADRLRDLAKPPPPKPPEPEKEKSRWEFDTQDPESKGLHLDAQALAIANRSSGGKRTFFSQDTQLTLPVKDWQIVKFTAIRDRLEISAGHELAFGVTESFHLNDPTETVKWKGHTQLSVQIDVIDIDVKKGER